MGGRCCGCCEYACCLQSSIGIGRSWPPAGKVHLLKPRIKCHSHGFWLLINAAAAALRRMSCQPTEKERYRQSTPHLPWNVFSRYSTQLNHSAGANCKPIDSQGLTSLYGDNYVLPQHGCLKLGPRLDPVSRKLPNLTACREWPNSFGAPSQCPIQNII